MKRSVILGSSLAVLLSSLAFASPIQDWTLAYVQDAPCTYWNGGDGRCLQWYSNYQFFSDYNATLSGFQVYTGAVADLDTRIAALEAKAKPAIKADSNAIPQWTLTSVQDAVCVYWNGRNGDCLRWDTNYQYFPDYNSTQAGFQLYTTAINSIDKRVSALEGKSAPASSGKTIADSQTAPAKQAF